MEIDYLKLTRERIVSNTQRIPTKVILLLFFSFLALFIVISLDAVYNPIDYTMIPGERDNAPYWKKLISKLITEKKPVFDSVALLRTALMVGFGLLVVSSIHYLQGPNNTHFFNHSLTHKNNLIADDPFKNAFNRIVIWVILLSSLSFLTLFLIDPVAFYN